MSQPVDTIVDEPAWMDAELVVLDLLRPLVPTGTAVTQLDMGMTPPCIQVQRVGGFNDGITDRPLMQVVCFGATRQAAWSMSRAVEQHILAAPGHSISGQYVTNAVIDHAETAVAGHQSEYINPDIRMVISTFRIDFRRPF